MKPRQDCAKWAACYWAALNWHRVDDVDVRADNPSDMPSSVCIFEHICTIVRLWIGSADDADVSGVAGTWTLADWWCSAMSALSLIKCFQQQYTSHYRRCYHQLSALKLFPMTYQNHTILLSWTIHTYSIYNIIIQLALLKFATQNKTWATKMSLRLIPWHDDPNEDASDDEDFPQSVERSVQSDDVSVSWEPSKSRSSLEQARYHVSPIRNNSFHANTWTHTKRNTHTNVCKQSHTNQRLQKNVSHHKDAHAYTNTCTQLGYTWESKLQCGGTATMLNTLHKHTLTPISDDGDADNHAFVEKSFCFSFLATQVLLLLLVLLLI